MNRPSPAETAFVRREAHARNVEVHAYGQIWTRRPVHSPPHVLVRAGSAYAEVHVVVTGRIALVAELDDGTVELHFRGIATGGDTITLPIPPNVSRVVALWSSREDPPRRSLAALLAAAADFDGAEIAPRR